MILVSVIWLKLMGVWLFVVFELMNRVGMCLIFQVCVWLWLLVNCGYFGSRFVLFIDIVSILMLYFLDMLCSIGVIVWQYGQLDWKKKIKLCFLVSVFKCCFLLILCCVLQVLIVVLLVGCLSEQFSLGFCYIICCQLLVKIVFFFWVSCYSFRQFFRFVLVGFIIVMFLWCFSFCCICLVVLIFFSESGCGVEVCGVGVGGVIWCCGWGVFLL